MPRIFDIENAQHLFDIVEHRFRCYRTNNEKSTEDIIAIIMILNHLREWIAPKYEPQASEWPPANSRAKQVSRHVYEHPSFAVIRELCNGTKHAKIMKSTSTEYDTNILASRDVVALRDIFRGVPVCHSVDGLPIEQHIELVMELYRKFFNQP
jgi:hypothetical protein